jgi:hypothetical protein
MDDKGIIGIHSAGFFKNLVAIVVESFKNKKEAEASLGFVLGL